MDDIPQMPDTLDGCALDGCALDGRALDGCKTARLQFSRFRESDADFLLQLMNQPGYLAHIGDRGLRTREDAISYLNTRLTYSDEGLGFYKLSLVENQTPVGMAGLARRDFLPAPDVGYALLADYEGWGFATESSLAVLAFARTLPGITEVGAIISPDNHASIRVVKKLGMTWHSQVAFPGESDPVDYYHMAINEQVHVDEQGIKRNE